MHSNSISTKTTGLERPAEIVIEVTSKCNFHCEGCFNTESFAEFGRGPSLSLDTVFKIIDSASSAKVEMIRFTGGEALLWPDLLTAIHYAKSKGVHTRLNTNASLITEKILTELESCLDSVLVSVNGVNAKEDEDWTNTPQSFEKKLKGLELLSKSKIKLRIGTVLTKNNISNLDKIYDLISPFNPSHWEVYRMITKDIKESIEDDIEVVLIKLAYLSAKFGQLIPIANATPFCLYDKEVLSKFCAAGAAWDDGHSRMIIDPRGFAKPSYYINENLGDPTNILAAWNHPFMKSMRSLEMVPEDCKDCTYRLQCKGGSRYKAFSVSGSYKARDPLMKGPLNNN